MGACEQQQLQVDVAGTVSYDTCRVAVPVAAGCITLGKESTPGSLDAMSSQDPELVNIEHTIASYKAKCLAAQHAVDEALSPRKSAH